MSDRPDPEYVQPPVRADGPVVLAGPDPAWAGQYVAEKQRIQAALGTRALLIEHVGSTSVPDLPAKPVIDILVAVDDAADEPAYLADLEAAGFVLLYREAGLGEHRLLRRDDPNVHVHVFTVRTPEVERMLLFRDRLRAVPHERELYWRTKRELANRRWEYMRDYANAKSAVVEEIIARARATRNP